jgi:DNA-binding transcriptional MerR regulator
MPRTMKFEILTTGEAALAIGVAAETIRHWENTGRLPCMRTPTGRRVFRVSDVERIARGRDRSEAEKAIR